MFMLLKKIFCIFANCKSPIIHYINHSHDKKD